jgi:3-hydroxyisobutyrate dehydrogenase-like beta-hydroxyacid dehydrogenase
MSRDVAVIGLGKMGSAIAHRLLADDMRVFVGNRTPSRLAEVESRGALRLASSVDALKCAPICITALADDAALEAVTCGDRGVLSGGRRGTVLIDTSTVSIAVSRRVADVAARAGVLYLRAPISGNPDALRSGAASMFVSGPAEAVERCDAVLRRVVTNFRYVGEGEEARAVKLALQVMIAGTAELLSESLAVAQAAGVDDRTMLEVIRSSVLASTFIAYKAEALADRNYSATFTTAMMAKDVELVLDLAERSATSLPVVAVLRELLEQACEQGYAEDDFISLARLRRAAL